MGSTNLAGEQVDRPRWSAATLFFSGGSSMQNQGQNNPQHQSAQSQDPQHRGQDQEQDQMALSPQEQQRAAQQTARNESGLPGGGVGRKDEVGHTGVYPLSV